MKIIKVESIPLNVPILNKWLSGVGLLSAIENILVKVYTDQGIMGIGEAATWGAFGEDSKSTYVTLNDYLAPTILGEDPYSIEKVMNKMDKAHAGGSFAKAAIEMALYDIIGKSLNQPVYNLLGGMYRTGVKMSFSIALQDIKKELEQISKCLAMGIQIFKVKMGVMSQVEDIERLKGMRKLLEGRAELRIDYNQSLSGENAIRYCRQLEEFNPTYIEQPVPYWDIDGLARVAKAIDTPIMADESVYSFYDAMKLVKKEAADMFSIKLMKSGGIRNGQKIAAVAESANIPCYSGLKFDSSVGMSAALHFAVATKNVSYGGDYYIPYFLMKQDIVVNPHKFEGGFVVPNDKPGLGVELNDEVVEKFRIK